MNRWVVLILIIAVTTALYSFSGKGGASALSYKGAPTTREQLGEMLFFERRLSANGKFSCASCHIPACGFADTVAFSKGVAGSMGKRNTPSCMNVSGRPYLFYDGHAATLEEQVHFPIEDKTEMGMPVADAVKKLAKDKNYVRYFRAIYNALPTVDNVSAAIAAYERTLETSHTPFDRYMDGDSLAMSASAIRGRELFMGTKAKCFDCHFTPDFTGDEFRNIGLYDSITHTDKGRYTISHNRADIGKFKVPGLRNVAVTAPYMHNGMFKTLREVIDYYDDPYKVVKQPINIDSLLMQPLHLTGQEKTDIENFLLALTDDRFKSKQ